MSVPALKHVPDGTPAIIDDLGRAGTPDAKVNDPLAIRLEREIRAGHIALPVLPTLALEVEDLINRDSDVSVIVHSIEREPSVAAGLIRYANAAMFTGLREVTEIEQAVVRLGLNSVRAAVVSLSAASAFKTEDAAHKKFYQAMWVHSLTTATAARRLASYVSVPKETAFLAGLLHDIGRVVVFHGIHAMKRRSPERYTVPDRTIQEFTDALHCRMGQVLGEAWNIPATLIDAIARHHDPALTGPDDVLPAVVQIADLMAKKIGASLTPDPKVKLLDKPSFHLLQLDDVKVSGILVDLEDERDRMMHVF